ncbi:hypothetical protein SAMN04488107_2524 [Geodermatophilus saharensis]|uniref:Uncharacterized protein n=1 Tax=Geodermatophilus saharensis TaxID=1137994 RepID=A0A239EH13_9ACTN|nr:hypothetical protein [Geodermatophilus saharensis]SNS43174.1 hypothetical protein SAMN04488107_2524 [Geodermatophilus saharensis]
MALPTCPVCDSGDLDGVEKLPDGRLVVRCLACDHEWVRGEALVPAKPALAASYESLKGAFPTADDVRPQVRQRVEALIDTFLETQPQTDPQVAPYWAKYQQIFSEDGLWEADPEDLKAFANNSVGAHPGNMSVFNQGWNEMGTEKAAQRLRRTIDHLLRGPAGTRLEDRFTDLVEERRGLGMVGFKESLLTRVLCVVEPNRFLPILKYSTPSGGKKEIALLVYGLDLPAREKVSWTIGRLVAWSNDLLVGLLRERFTDLQHASAFLWWAKDQAPAGA